jgi:hypothetical protein
MCYVERRLLSLLDVRWSVKNACDVIEVLLGALTLLSYLIFVGLYAVEYK